MSQAAPKSVAPWLASAAPVSSRLQRKAEDSTLLERIPAVVRTY